LKSAHRSRGPADQTVRTVYWGDFGGTDRTYTKYF